MLSGSVRLVSSATKDRDYRMDIGLWLSRPSGQFGQMKMPRYPFRRPDGTRCGPAKVLCEDLGLPNGLTKWATMIAKTSSNRHFRFLRGLPAEEHRHKSSSWKIDKTCRQ